MPIQREDNNALENIRPHEDEKSIRKEQDIEQDDRNLVSKRLDSESHIKNGLSRYIAQDVLLASELSSFLTEVIFHKHDFLPDKAVLDIKYYQLGS